MVARQRDGSYLRKVLGSCVDCLAWGIPYAQGLCSDCYNFCAPQLQRSAGPCGACGWDRVLKDGYCRLCWCQAREDRKAFTDDARTQVMIAPHLPNVRFQQLFFAAMHTKPKAPPRNFPRRYGEKGRPRKPPPPAARRPDLGWLQPPLFVEHIPREYTLRRIDLRRGSAPENPWLAWAAHIAHGIFERRGWQEVVRRNMQRALVQILAGHVDGDVVLASETRPVTLARSVNPDHLLEILTAMGILVDDRPRTFDLWLATKADQLPPAIGRDLTAWALSLHDGGPRSRARRPSTAVAYVGYVLPALRQWSATYDHLREVTYDDAAAYTANLQGADRHHALTALRSLFRWAKRHKLIFRNPTSRIRAEKTPDPVWQLLAAEQIACAVTAATTSQARVFVALAAIHAARPGHIRAMRLDDVDLANRRLTIAGLSRPMDDLTHHVITTWLEYRRARWPHTANPHLMISYHTALGLGQVSATYLGPSMEGLPATIDRLRVHRQLEEAVANQADPLHLTAVFGITAATAVKYANSARQLLETTIENSGTTP